MDFLMFGDPLVSSFTDFLDTESLGNTFNFFQFDPLFALHACMETVCSVCFHRDDVDVFPAGSFVDALENTAHETASSDGQEEDVWLSAFWHLSFDFVDNGGVASPNHRVVKRMNNYRPWCLGSDLFGSRTGFIDTLAHHLQLRGIMSNFLNHEGDCGFRDNHSAWHTKLSGTKRCSDSCISSRRTQELLANVLDSMLAQLADPSDLVATSQLCILQLKEDVHSRFFRENTASQEWCLNMNRCGQWVSGLRGGTRVHSRL